MRKTLDIDGRKVEFKANAMTAVKYREKFSRDMLKDMNMFEDAKTVSVDMLMVFYHIAWTMAKQADSNIPDDPGEWLDSFEEFRINDVMPPLIKLWKDSTITLETPKNV